MTKKIVININGHKGRPKGATKEATRIRNGMILRAYYKGFRRKAIADMMGISYQYVCKVIKEAKEA